MPFVLLTVRVGLTDRPQAHGPDFVDVRAKHEHLELVAETRHHCLPNEIKQLDRADGQLQRRMHPHKLVAPWFAALQGNRNFTTASICAGSRRIEARKASSGSIGSVATTLKSLFDISKPPCERTGAA